MASSSPASTTKRASLRALLELLANASEQALPAESRTAVQIARNLMEGAAVITRAQQLRPYGVPVPNSAFRFAPRPLK